MRRLVLPILWLTVMHAVPARVAAQSPRCIALREEPAQIEVLPRIKMRGNTCNSPLDGVSTYGEPCPLRGVGVLPDDYDGHDVVYEVFLHEGNHDVEFVLDVLDERDGVAQPGDLALALLNVCDDGGTCNRSSLDGFGSADERLPPAAYPPNVYYLVVDSAADGRCGPYELSVMGVNPTPDLQLTVALPAEVVAGKELTYSLTVSNAASAKLAASVVSVTLELPRNGVRLRMPEDCSKTVEEGVEKVTCPIRDLVPGEEAPPRQITVDVQPSFRGKLVAPRAEARALEADATPAEVTEIETKVKGLSDLSVVVQAARSVVAGGKPPFYPPLTYALQVHNAGPSDALAARVTATLDGQAVLSKPAGCSRAGNQVTCTVAKIKAGATAELLLDAEVPSSASGVLRLDAAVAVAAGEEEKDPRDDNDRDCPPASPSRCTTRVDRETDLAIVKTSPPQGVIGCRDAQYALTVHNDGPSDSTGPTVTDHLRPGVILVGPLGGVCHSVDEVNGTKVTCKVGEVPSGQEKTLPITVRLRESSATTPQLPSSISDMATVEAHERDKDRNDTNNASLAVVTDVHGADLRLVGLSVRQVSALPSTADATSVIAGENLLYTIEVANGGPDQSRDATVTVDLDPDVNPGKGAELVGSTGRCSPQPGHPSRVTCSVSPLRSGVAQAVELVARLAADASSESMFTSTARVDPVGTDDDTCVENDESDVVALRVERQADLSVSLTDAPDPVAEGGDLVYAVAVTNAGPSDASDVRVQLELPGVVSSVQGSCDCSKVAGGLLCEHLAAGSRKHCAITVVAPQVLEGETRILTASAKVSSTLDPDPTDNESKTTTTLAKDGEADLAVSKTAESEAVVAGDLVEYTIAVTNNGPTAADWTAQDLVCDGLTLVSALPEGCTKADTADGQLITCASLAALPALESIAIPLRVKVTSDFVGDCVFAACAPPPSGSTAPTATVDNAATVSTQGVTDPVPNNNQDCSRTTLLRSRSLVLPFFEAEESRAGATTLFAVSNPTDSNVGVRYDYVFATGPPSSAPVCLKPHATDTRNLRDVLPLELATAQGHVVVEPDATACVPPAPADVPALDLGGDFFRLDRLPSPAHDRAGGELLISADTSRLPPELCELWDTRFLNDAARGLSTEFVFYVPRAGNAEVVAVGQVYTEDGKPLQKVEVRAPIVGSQRQLAFRQSGAALLTKFGAVEWELRDENGPIAGNVSVVHRTADRSVVALPGVCRRPPAGKDLGPEPPLVLPYFEVNEAGGVTTLLAVRNGTDQAVEVQFDYFSAQGDPIPVPTDERKAVLGAHATRTRNLRDISALTTGWVQLTLVEQPGSRRAERVLSGDYVRVDGAGAAGGALVDSDIRRIPAQLCSRWDVRFINDGPLVGSRTRFLFYVPRPDGSTVVGDVYSENGDGEGQVSFETPGVAFACGSELFPCGRVPSGAGTIEWDLGDVRGHVAAILEAAGSSVLVPGICRDPDRRTQP